MGKKHAIIKFHTGWYGWVWSRHCINERTVGRAEQTPNRRRLTHGLWDRALRDSILLSCHQLIMYKGKTLQLLLLFYVHVFFTSVRRYCVSEPAGDHLHLSLQEASHSNQPDHSLSGCGWHACWTYCHAYRGHQVDWDMLVLWGHFL